MNKLLMKLEAVLGAGLLRLWRATLRVCVEGQPPESFPCVYAVPHRNILIMAMQRIGSDIAVMASSSRDGELIAGPLRHLGLITVRGSSTRQGAEALKEMIRLAKDHSLAITPDGPKGPVGTIQPGLFQLALLARVPVIPISAWVSREWVFNTWDKFRLPKPFSRIHVKYGRHITVSSREDFDSAERQLREEWKEMERSFGTGMP
jgi:lysophospholipid acyltransferase (LPLAT)-like uncharacterized protein